MTESKHTSLLLDQLVIDAVFQVRVGGLNTEHADDLAAVLKLNGVLPPVKVCAVSGIGNIVTDGFHTVEAHKRANRPEVVCILSQGTREEAMLAAATANREHDRSGLKRTNADKRRAVGLILTCVAGWSDNLIAEHVGVSHPLVAKVRRELSNSHQLETDSSLHSSESLREGADGKFRGPKHRAPHAPTAPQMPGVLPILAPTNCEAKLPKLGSEIQLSGFDSRAFDSHFGYVARGVHQMAEDPDFKNTPECHLMLQTITKFAELWQRVEPRFRRRKSTR